MWKGILAAVVVLLILLSAFIAAQPDDFRVERSVVIAAAPAEVFPYVNNLRNWDAWAPWAGIDPDSKVDFAGPEEGEGSSMTWNGNNDVGEGTITILESLPGEMLKYRLDFRRPMEDTAMADFMLKAQEGGNATEVTWSMYGQQNSLARRCGSSSVSVCSTRCSSRGSTI